LAVKGQQPDRILTAYASGNFFEGLGLKPAAGRLFLRSEGEVLGRDAVIVLGYDYWQQRFNGDPTVVGRTVTLDGHPLTIVGVAPKGFGGMQGFLTTAAYLPLSQLPIGGTPQTPSITGRTGCSSSMGVFVPESTSSRQCRAERRCPGHRSPPPGCRKEAQH
jgi:hypothetical protein